MRPFFCFFLLRILLYQSFDVFTWSEKLLDLFNIYTFRYMFLWPSKINIISKKKWWLTYNKKIINSIVAFTLVINSMLSWNQIPNFLQLQLSCFEKRAKEKFNFQPFCGNSNFPFSDLCNLWPLEILHGISNLNFYSQVVLLQLFTSCVISSHHSWKN